MPSRQANPHAEASVEAAGSFPSFGGAFAPTIGDLNANSGSFASLLSGRTAMRSCHAATSCVAVGEPTNVFTSAPPSLMMSRMSLDSGLDAPAMLLPARGVARKRRSRPLFDTPSTATSDSRSLAKVQTAAAQASCLICNAFFFAFFFPFSSFFLVVIKSTNAF